MYVYIYIMCNHLTIGPVGAALVVALQSIVFRWQDVSYPNDSNRKPVWHSFAQPCLERTIDKAGANLLGHIRYPVPSSQFASALNPT